MTAMQRVHILVESDQYAALREIARDEGLSVSALMRIIVRRYLANYALRDPHSDQRHTSEELAEIREHIRARHRIQEGDLLTEIRTERDDDLDQVWRGEWPQPSDL